MQITLTQKHLDDLLNFNFFTTRTGMSGQYQAPVQRFKVGDKINFINDCTIEQHSTIAAGYHLFSIGSLSSCASSFPESTIVGRFCGVATGCSCNIGWRHPIEAVCMTSAVYNFQREYCYSYFTEYEEKYGEQYSH